MLTAKTSATADSDRGGLPSTSRPTLSMGGYLFISVKAVEWVFLKSKSRGASRLVLLSIASHVNTDGCAWPSLDTIQEHSLVSRPTILKALDELEELGEIQVQRGGGGPRDTNFYYFPLFMGRVNEGKIYEPKGKAERAELEFLLPEVVEFRRAVLERDGNVCQWCGETKGRMEVHHIKPVSKFPELRFEVSNGITLCISCHDSTRGRPVKTEESSNDQTLLKEEEILTKKEVEEPSSALKFPKPVKQKKVRTYPRREFVRRDDGPRQASEGQPRVQFKSAAERRREHNERVFSEARRILAEGGKLDV